MNKVVLIGLSVFWVGPLFAEGNCALTGSSSVFVGGKPALRLSDVSGCKDVAYEVIPGLFVEGEPAVRLVPKKGDCTVSGAASVMAGGKPVQRAGDLSCAEEVK